MALTDHIAILTHAALAEPVVNKKKANKPSEFYALIAFPPAAGNDLADLAKQVAPGGNLAGLSMNVKPNGQQGKPIPGVPGDWFIVRAATQFAPYIADVHGRQMDQSTEAPAIRTKFYAGKKIRAALTAFAWNYDGKPGVSYNLAGVMEAGDGERLAIGNSASAAFEKYADKSEKPLEHSGQRSNPFGGSTTQGASSGSTAGGDNPFAQTGNRSAPNPFVDDDSPF